MKEKNTIPDALNAAERLVRLFKDPQPGLSTWHKFLATALADLDRATGDNWIAVGDEMPDAEISVMLFSPKASEPVWPGFRDGDEWRYVDASTAEGVTHWRHFPNFPRGSK